MTDHTAAINSLKGCLNQFTIRLGSRDLKLKRTQESILEARDWSALQRDLMAESFADIEHQVLRRQRLTRLMAQAVCAEPLICAA